jgi:hypothetical protein
MTSTGDNYVTAEKEVLQNGVVLRYIRNRDECVSDVLPHLGRPILLFQIQNTAKEDLSNPCCNSTADSPRGPSDCLLPHVENERLCTFQQLRFTTMP